MQGYKTYISAGALLAFAIYGLITGHLDSDMSITLILNAFGMFGLRSAIASK